MAEIALSNGGVALIDDEDLDLVSRHEWKRLTVAKEYHYVITRGNPRLAVLLHRLLMQPGEGNVVDHINGNGLDNRRANLRVCTHAENMRNRRKPRHGKTPFKGIYYRAAKNRWVAVIGKYRGGAKALFVGCHKTPEEAAMAYDLAAVLRHGEFACLNFPHVWPEVPSRRKA